MHEGREGDKKPYAHLIHEEALVMNKGNSDWDQMHKDSKLEFLPVY